MQVITREEFANEVLLGLRERGASDFVFDEKAFSVRATTEPSAEHFLGFLYGEVEAAATDRDRRRVIDRAIENTIASRASLDRPKAATTHERLMPVLATRRHYAIDIPAQAARARGWVDPSEIDDDGIDDDEIEHQVIGEHLAVGLALDHDARIEYVLEASELGLGFEAAYARAIENLRRTRTSPLRALTPSVYGSLGDDYESARMLLTDELRALPLRGDPVVMVPWRGAIFVTGSRDAIGMGVVRKIASEPPAGARPISSAAFRLDEADRWHPFDDDGGNAWLEENLRREIQSAYVAQQAAITARDPSGGEARGGFYASIMQRGDERTLATWTPGVATLLPKVDDVALNMRFPIETARDEALRAAANGREAPIVVSWETFVAICGPTLRERDDLYPRRWATRRYPTEEEVQRLLAASAPVPGTRRTARATLEEPDFVDAMIPKRQRSPGLVVALVVACAAVAYLLREFLFGR